MWFVSAPSLAHVSDLFNRLSKNGLSEKNACLKDVLHTGAPRPEAVHCTPGDPRAPPKP